MMVYPILRRSATAVEKLALRIRHTPGFCPVCGRWSFMVAWTENYRESGRCRNCLSTNRQRQLSWMLCRMLSESLGARVRSLRDVPHGAPITLYNAETSGAVHEQLRRLPGYACSEYFGPDHRGGELVNGVRHEDLQQLSFDDNSLDVMLSSDVFEHVPDPYKAFREVHRVLRSGGRHIFTVPFHQTEFQDDVRAVIENGDITLIKEPIYHLDPLRPEGILVYTIFALEMPIKLRNIGFRTNVHLLYRPSIGILGNNGLVFEAIKL